MFSVEVGQRSALLALEQLIEAALSCSLLRGTRLSLALHGCCDPHRPKCGWDICRFPEQNRRVSLLFDQESPCRPVSQQEINSFLTLRVLFAPADEQKTCYAAPYR